MRSEKRRFILRFADSGEKIDAETQNVKDDAAHLPMVEEPSKFLFFPSAIRFDQ